MDGIKFILVYNPAVFSGIVKNKYGCDDYSARIYIHKFVEMEYTLNLDLRSRLSSFLYSEISFLPLGDSNSANRVKSMLDTSGTIARVLIDFNVTSLREIKLLNKSILELLKDAQIGDDSFKFWYIIALLKLIDYEEYEEIVSYLAMNQSFASNLPKRRSRAST